MNVNARILVGDNRQTLKQLPDESVQCVVTSPPYWGLRDYGEDDQIGLEQTPAEYVEKLCKVFDEVWRVLKDDGTLWLNLGDSYAAGKMGRDDSGDNGRFGGERLTPKQRKAPDGFKPKDLVGIPWRVAFALQERGWYLRQDIIWAKPNPMPESVTDRCTKSHEYIFLLTKQPRYYFDNEAIKEPSVTGVWDAMPPMGGIKYGNNDDQKFATKSGNTPANDGFRNKRDVWNVATKPYSGAHFAVYPTELITPCILAGSKEGDLILDPFSGSGTTGEVALLNGRNYVGTELNPEYAKLSEERIYDAIGMLGTVEVIA